MIFERIKKKKKVLFITTIFSSRGLVFVNSSFSAPEFSLFMVKKQVKHRARSILSRFVNVRLKLEFSSIVDLLDCALGMIPNGA
jgi:hypothetical protein